MAFFALLGVNNFYLFWEDGYKSLKLISRQINSGYKLRVILGKGSAF